MSEFAALVRFVHLSAAIVLAGGFGFQLLVAPPSMDRSSRQRQRICCVVVFFVTLPLILYLQAANIGGTPRIPFGAVFPLVTETQFGKVWLARVAILIVIAFLVLRRTTNITLNFTLSTTFLATSVLAGHAAAIDGMTLTLQLGSDALHVVAGGIWLGGLLPLWVLIGQCNSVGDQKHLTVAQEATRRFSNLALASVILLIASGSYNAWNLVGGFAPLLGTSYGQLLLGKLGLLLPLLIIGANNLSRLRPTIVATTHSSEEARGALRKLSRNLKLEMFLGLAILLIVGHLGVTPPARHVQPVWPLSFRWDWTVLEKSPKALAEAYHGAIWTGVGAIVLIGAVVRRKRRQIALAIGVSALAYAGHLVHQAVMIDAYPDTYKRPAVAYQAISVTTGATLYRESGCAACHGDSGHGDGPVAAELNPPPPDLTGRHANAHTAGDLFWWLSHGVKPTSAMPGFSQSLSEEQRWDLINYLRALSSGQRAKNLAPVIDDQPTLVAPDFNYATVAGEAQTLKDHRGGKIVLLALVDSETDGARLRQLTDAAGSLQSAGVELIVVTRKAGASTAKSTASNYLVSEGNQEITATYKLFARSFSEEKSNRPEPHVEYLIDKQGYIRARWLPTENDSWRDLTALKQQIDLLAKEQPRAPAPDDHVH